MLHKQILLWQIIKSFQQGRLYLDLKSSCLSIGFSWYDFICCPHKMCFGLILLGFQLESRMTTMHTLKQIIFQSSNRQVDINEPLMRYGFKKKVLIKTERPLSNISWFLKTCYHHYFNGGKTTMSNPPLPKKKRNDELAPEGKPYSIPTSLRMTLMFEGLIKGRWLIRDWGTQLDYSFHQFSIWKLKLCQRNNLNNIILKMNRIGQQAQE